MRFRAAFCACAVQPPSVTTAPDPWYCPSAWERRDQARWEAGAQRTLEGVGCAPSCYGSMACRSGAVLAVWHTLALQDASLSTPTVRRSPGHSLMDCSSPANV